MKSYTYNDPVRTREGWVSGATIGDADHPVKIYRGVRYAAAPVGELRWKPPQPAPVWDGIRECTEMPRSTPQAIGTIVNTQAIAQSEDCLNLNILTPARHNDEKLPVMVWLHGGAFIHGNANEAFFNSPRLPQKGVVLVNVNHRIGPIGQLAHRLLSKESPHGVSGNYMTLDIIAALDWIKSNIAAFGGDANNVTIFGESGGGAKVLTLICSPLATGLFDKAIIESGGVLGTLNGQPLKHHEEIGEALFRQMGVDQAPDPLAAARALPWEEVIQADMRLVKELGLNAFRWDSTIDGRVLSDTTPNLIKSGKAPNIVPFLAGCNLGEIDSTGYPFLTFPSMIPYYVSLLEGARKAGAPTYAYLFDQVPPGWRKGGCVSFHRLEPGYVFGDYDDKYGFFTSDAALLAPVSGAKQKEPELGDADRRVSEKMMALWTQFAKTGNPSLAGDIEWPTYDLAGDNYLMIVDPPEVRSGYSKLVE